jgi:hypothetical protein
MNGSRASGGARVLRVRVGSTEFSPVGVCYHDGGMNTDLASTGNGSPAIGAHETRWAAATGLWEFHGPSATYIGPTSGEGFPAYGIALTNRNLTDGTVRVGIRFSEVDSEGHISGVAA